MNLPVRFSVETGFNPRFPLTDPSDEFTASLCDPPQESGTLRPSPTPQGLHTSLLRSSSFGNHCRYIIYVSAQGRAAFATWSLAFYYSHRETITASGIVAAACTCI